MILFLEDRVGGGAYGDVFRVDDRAIKVFKRPPGVDVGTFSSDPGDVAKHRLVFEAEREMAF